MGDVRQYTGRSPRSQWAASSAMGVVDPFAQLGFGSASAVPALWTAPPVAPSEMATQMTPYAPPALPRAPSVPDAEQNQPLGFMSSTEGQDMLREGAQMAYQRYKQMQGQQPHDAWDRFIGGVAAPLVDSFRRGSSTAVSPLQKYNSDLMQELSDKREYEKARQKQALDDFMGFAKLIDQYDPQSIKSLREQQKVQSAALQAQARYYDSQTHAEDVQGKNYQRMAGIVQKQSQLQTLRDEALRRSKYTDARITDMMERRQISRDQAAEMRRMNAARRKHLENMDDAEIKRLSETEKYHDELNNLRRYNDEMDMSLGLQREQGLNQRAASRTVTKNGETNYTMDEDFRGVYGKPQQPGAPPQLAAPPPAQAPMLSTGRALPPLEVVQQYLKLRQAQPQQGSRRGDIFWRAR